MAYTPPILTTKGDVLSYSTQRARVAVGLNRRVMTADSTQTSGVIWSPLVTIGQVVASGSPSTIDFSSIPSTYSDLLMVVTGRDTDSGVVDGLVRMKINNDGTAGNYSDMQYISGIGASVGGAVNAATSAGCIVGDCPGTLSNADAIGGFEILIPAYAGTNFHKVALANSRVQYGAATPTQRFMRAFAWKSTAAINQLTLTAGATAFATDTTATLYGLG